VILFTRKPSILYGDKKKRGRGKETLLHFVDSDERSRASLEPVDCM